MARPAFVQQTRFFIARVLLRLGRIASLGFVEECVNATGLLEIGQWLHTRGLWPRLTLAGGDEVFELIARDVGEKKALYLEFGVFEGCSMRRWARLHKNPTSLLHGFDSFEGLPEDWQSSHPKGTFSTQGRLPVIADPRVRFFEGWFEETLPKYQIPPHDVMVVNMDADLYRSTKCVLNHLKSALKPGDWLYFDQFRVYYGEYRAFREFVEETGMQFEAVAESEALYCIAFRCL